MPLGDLIFKRLNAATPMELALIAAALKIKLKGSREEDVDLISRKYRAASINKIVNLFRQNHELEYSEILHSVARQLATEIGLLDLEIPPNVTISSAEDFTIAAFSSICDPAFKGFSAALIQQERAKLPLLLSTAKQTALPSTLRVIGGVIAGLATPVTPVMAVLAPIAVIKFLTDPSKPKMAGATIMMIHIRNRLAHEATLCDTFKDAL